MSRKYKIHKIWHIISMYMIMIREYQEANLALAQAPGLVVQR